jgi:hypothetical protein
MVNNYSAHETLSLLSWALEAPEWRTDKTILQAIDQIDELVSKLVDATQRMSDLQRDNDRLRATLTELVEHYTRPDYEIPYV